MTTPPSAAPAPAPRTPGSALVPHQPHLARTIAALRQRAKRLEQRTRRESVVFTPQSGGVQVAKADVFNQTHLTVVARSGHRLAVDCFCQNPTQAVVRVRLSCPDFNLTGPVIGNDYTFNPPPANLDPGGEGGSASPIAPALISFLHAAAITLASLLGLGRLARTVATLFLPATTPGGETGGSNTGTGSSTGVTNPGGEGGATSGQGDVALDTSGGRLITATLELPGGWKIGDRHIVYVEASQPTTSPASGAASLYVLRAVQR